MAYGVVVGRASSDLQALLNDGTSGARLDADDQLSDGRDPHRSDAFVSRQDFTSKCRLSQRATIAAPRQRAKLLQ